MTARTTFDGRWTSLRLVAFADRFDRPALARLLVNLSVDTEGDEFATLSQLLEIAESPAIGDDHLKILIAWLALGNLEGIGPDEAKARVALEMEISPARVELAAVACGVVAEGGAL